MSLRLSTAPHIRSHNSTRRLMGNVLVALLPAAVAGVYYFGFDALFTLFITMTASVFFEYVWQKLAKLPIRIGDFSALLTGLILGLILPPTAPWWLSVVGAAFAIIIVKQLFGGIGDNFLNPAMAARAALLASWPARMTAFVAVSKFASADAVASATPLSQKIEPTLWQLFIGEVPGAIGETCKLAILIGLAFLLITRTISWRIPVITIASAFVFSWLFGSDPVEAVLSGGMLFAAVFMATDYATSPMSSRAQIPYAIGIGLITSVIRAYGSYPEGVTYAVLLMNILAPLLDRFMPHKIYGHAKTKEAKQA